MNNDHINDILENSRAMKYPDTVSNTDKFESEDTTDWDKAFALASDLIDRDYPVPTLDKYSLAMHIMSKWKAETPVEEKDNLGDNKWL